MRHPRADHAPPTAATTPPRTATVHDFRCLYTADVQRKHKRWRDGLLRFHAFNARVVVYDAGGISYVGDGHWPRGVPPPLGEEVEHLGRLGEGEVLLQLMNGVLVQVEEARGSSVTDLTPLFERRAGAPAESRKGSAPQDQGPPRRNPPPPRDRSLRAILDTRPATSAGAGATRSAPPRPLRRPVLELARNPPQQWRPRLEQADRSNDGPARKRIRQDPPEAGLCSDDDVVECGAPLPPTSSIDMLPTPTRNGIARPAALPPPRISVRPMGAAKPKPAEDPPSRPPEPAISAHPVPISRAPRRVGITRMSLGSKPWKPPQPLSDPPPSSPPASTENVFRNIDDYDPPMQEVARRKNADDGEEVVVPGPKPKAKPLRLAAAKPKPKLLCLQAERVWRQPEPEPDPISDYSSSGSSAFTDS
jgi:hypothetical protein